MAQELSIEQKANAYDKALEAVKSLREVNPSDEGIQNWVNENFPELKESEDERIREALINQFSDYKRRGENHGFGYSNDKILVWLEKQGQTRKITHEEICKSYGIPDIGEFSDGHHTFNGLYKQRMILFAVLVNTYKDRAWKSWKHYDGLDCFGGGWFIVGIDTPAGTYTYHYEAKDWDRFDCQILDKAKHWDGHDEFDAERLFSLVEKQGEQKTIWHDKDEDPCEHCKDRCLNCYNFPCIDKRTFEQGKTALEAIKEEKVDNANKVEPKFKVGNWYQCTKDFYGKGVTFDKNTAYYCAKEGCLQCEYGCHIAIVKDLYDNFKLWDISDAKDGDVLFEDKISSLPSPFIVIFKKKDSVNTISSHCFIGFDGKFYEGESRHYSENLHPATKEQCNLLFQKMKEAGYELDYVKKELKKIEQKPAWSEEDEKMFNKIIDELTPYGECPDYPSTEEQEYYYTRQEMIDWLKSFKERYTWKSSDEQIDALDT